MNHEKPAKRIAVVAVHGVADQQPRASARRIANLLQNLDDGRDPLYEPFIEREIRLSVRPFRIPNPSDPWKRPDLELAREALKGYEGEPADQVFETIRLESRREDGVCVHVYECYWADLSRLGAGFARFFGELYQLLFHLTRVGYHTIQAAARAREWTRLWWMYERLVNLTSALLTGPIPVIHLILAAIVIVIMSVGLLNGFAPWLQRASVLAVSAIVCWLGLAIPLRSQVTNSRRWLVVSLAPFAVLLPLAVWWSTELGRGETVLPANISAISEACRLEALPYLRVARIHAGHLQVFATLIALLSGVGVALVIRAYSRRRPGVEWFAAGLGIPALGMVLYAIWTAANAPSSLICSLLRVAFGPQLRLSFTPDHVMGWLRLSWAGLVLSLLTTEFVAWFLVLPASRPRRVVRRAVWTASITLVLPIFGFIVATPAIWSVFSGFAQRTLPAGFECGGLTGAQLVSGLISTELTRFLALLFVAGALAGVLAAWGLFAAVWSEVQPPRRSERNASRLSASIGAWLDYGYKLLGGAGFLLYTSVLLTAVGSIWIVLGGSLSWPDKQLADRIVVGLGMAFGGSAVGLLALRGRLNKSTAGFRNLLDVILDVDNHLKDRPVEATPRARIAGRYTSLLRYLCRHGVEDGNPYHAIVIIAHSQGTVITADLLRLLQAERTRAGSAQAHDPSLAPLGTSLPVYLFTMGSPLGQLYGLRFPDLYAWARNEDHQPRSTWQTGDISNLQPDPETLGLCQWVNAFRSGDYVGRQLWRHKQCDYRFAYPELLDETGPWPKELAGLRNVSSDHEGRRIEFCIGPGAHTHYWDETAPEISGELDQLVTRAARSRVGACSEER